MKKIILISNFVFIVNNKSIWRLKNKKLKEIKLII